MDNYKMEEVAMLIEKNLLTPDVLKNILHSTTKRIETYDDNESIKILNYLSNHESVPDETKEEINKYLAQYNSYHIENVEKNNNNEKENKNKIVLLYLLVIVLIVLFVIIFKRS